MNGRRWMVSIGAIVIVGMLMIACFSLGVYVGQRGWTEGALSPVGPGGGRPGNPPNGPGGAGGPPNPPGGPGGQGEPGQPPPQRDDLPPGPPNLVGRVERLEDGLLSLFTRDGLRSVELGEQTALRTTGGETVTTHALGTGTPVAVFGHPGADGRILVADVILILER